MRPTTRIIGSLVFATCLLASCNKAGPGTHAASITAKSGDDNVVNLYTWADYIAPDTLESFEKVTGVKVRVAMIETNGTLETRMLTGNSGYDLVVPAAPYFQRQIRSGAYLPLDKTKLPNLTNLDPAIMAQVSLIATTRKRCLKCYRVFPLPAGGCSSTLPMHRNWPDKQIPILAP